jgi:CheY-like chemotaxis protein
VRCDSLGAFYVPKGAETWEGIKSVLAEVLKLDQAALDAAEAKHGTQAEGGLLRAVRNKVLIVEDDGDLARALERRLRKCGAETMLASNGIDAYRMAVREQPDAIIADYVMPDGGGHYLLWRLKSTESTRHIPVIMITGQQLEGGTEHPLEREVGGRGGAVKFFRKPLDTDALFKELAQHCAIHYAPSEAPAGEPRAN